MHCQYGLHAIQRSRNQKQYMGSLTAFIRKSIANRRLRICFLLLMICGVKVVTIWLPWSRFAYQFDMEKYSPGNWKGEVCAWLHRWHICWKRSPSNDWWATFTNEWSARRKKWEVMLLVISINFKMEKQTTSMAATATICWYTMCFISWSTKTPEVCDWGRGGWRWKRLGC